MTGLALSFLAVIGLTLALSLAGPAVGRLRGKPWPPAQSLVRDGLLAVGITVAIVIAISFVLTWTGFGEAQFFRPSARDYGEHTKLGLAPEDVFFESADGTRLHGWFVPAQDSAVGTVVHLHGSDRNITQTIRNSAWLTEHGFNVFAFDYRGYGRSEGEPSRRGVVDDAAAAVGYVRSRPGVDPDALYLWGQSMGGQAAILAADQAGAGGVRGVVAEATYASPSHHVKDKLAQMGPLWLIQWGVWLATSDEPNARGAVGRLAPTPVLIVHGTADRGVRPYHGDWLFEAAGEPRAIWRVEGARHLDVFHDPEYRERLVRFLRDPTGQFSRRRR